MKIRNVAILMTWLLLLVTIVLPYIFIFNKDDFSTDFASSIAMAFGYFVSSSILWLATGSPLVVSLLIARKLKFGFPAFLLLVSTIIFGYWCGYVYYDAFSTRSSDFFMLPYIAMGSIFFMLPLWYIAWKINRIMIK